MISQMEFIRRVDVQSETIERYVREGKLIPDLVIPMRLSIYGGHYDELDVRICILDGLDRIS